ncbi:MAG: potassium transporter peripheral rane component [Pseudomonadota bacterium]
MKILILGAGQVGSSVAAALSVEDQNDITVVDSDAHRLRELTEKLDIRAVVGHASLPSVLAQAGLDDAVVDLRDEDCQEGDGGDREPEVVIDRLEWRTIEDELTGIGT